MCIAILGTVAFSHVFIFVCFVHNRERTRTEYEGGPDVYLSFRNLRFLPPAIGQIKEFASASKKIEDNMQSYLLPFFVSLSLIILA